MIILLIFAMKCKYYELGLFAGLYVVYLRLLHLALGIVLFFIINWIGARSVSIGYMQMNVVIQDDSAPAFNFLSKSWRRSCI